MHTPTDASLSARFSVLCGFFACLLFVGSASLGAAATLYVSQDGNDNNSGTATSPYRTIQAAVNNATSGDAITLHASTFSGNGNRNIDFAGKSLTINSDSGAARTVIDCGGTDQQSHRAFYFHSKETAFLSGVTIKNCDNIDGVEIGQGCTIDLKKCTFINDNDVCILSIIGDNATLTDCTFIGNKGRTCIENGGTIVLTGCVFSSNADNTGTLDTSGEINNRGMVTLTNCVFANNDGGLGGGGINTRGTVKATNCSFTNNRGYAGGGIFNDGTMNLFGCIFDGNTSACNGGGITTSGGAIVADCEFANNTSNGGGGIYNAGVMTLTNCIITGNSVFTQIHSTASSISGGGVWNRRDANIRFCTIVGNTAKQSENRGLVQGIVPQGGGLENDGNATLTNDILWGNDAPNAAEIGTFTDPGQIVTTTTTYSDIQGGLSGPGNIKANPLFVSTANLIMPPPLAVRNMGDADLHLQAGSPCRGAGITIGSAKPDPNQANNPNYKPDPGVSTDADGLHRPNPPSIGAYEYTANPPPVKKKPLLDIGGAETGSASDNATPTDGAASAPGAPVALTPNAVAVPAASSQARPTLGPAEQKQANDEFLHLMVSLNTNTLSHDEMTRQIQGELAKGAQIDARDGEGFPAIVTAASLKRTDVVQVLLELGADPNALTVQVSSPDASDDSSILHKTATGYQVNVGAVVSSIFGHKSKSKPVYGQSALMFAAQNDVADMVTLLLTAKVVVNMRDNRGKSSLDYASDAHHDDIAATLKAHGAD